MAKRVQRRYRPRLRAMFTLPSKSDKNEYIITILPERRISPRTASNNNNGQALDWYNPWLATQFAKLPECVLGIFSTSEEQSDERSGPMRHWQHFLSVFQKMEDYIAPTKSISIDQIIARLQESGLLARPSSDDGTDRGLDLEYARYFIFCAIGWQSMLYTPAFPGNTSTAEPPRLAIDEQPGCCSLTHMALETDTRRCHRETLSEFLLDFGVLLPSKNMCLEEDPNILHDFQHRTEVQASIFNAYTLSAVVGLRIKWVEALACHLELNTTTKELSLFRFPSFCRSVLSRFAEDRPGTLHGCATTSAMRHYWAAENEVNQMLVEVLLSYRLLFGQTRKSRMLFRSSLNPSWRRIASKSKIHDNKNDIRDPLLPALCAKDNPLDDSTIAGLTEKETYYLPRDFPIHRYRIVLLQRYLSASVPRTWMQLWRDNRDSAGWLTFWAVIAFGVFGSVMAFLQVVLQFVQVIMQ